MITQLFKGLSDYADAVGMISKYNLWRYVILPGCLSVIVISVIIGGPVSAFAFGGGEESLENSIIGLYPEGWWGHGFFEGFIHLIPFWILLLLLLTAAMFFVGKYLILIVASPFMGALSERIEEIVTGHKPPSDSNFMVDLIRGIRISLRNLVREIGLTLLFLLFNIIPGIGSMIGAILTFLVEANYAGFGNMDYTLERKGFNVSQSVKFVRKNRGAAIGNGIGFLLVLFIPVLGWFLAPAYGTIGATKAVLRRLEKEGKLS